MDQLAPSGAAEILPAGTGEKRKSTLIDIVYLLVLVWLYFISLVYPLAGIVLGIVLLSAGSTEDTKKHGRICLILGVVNVALFLMLMVLAITLGGVMSNLPGHWSGI